MIQKMKKLTFLVFHKEYDEFLNGLQQLGVVHIQPLEKNTECAPVKEGSAENIQTPAERLAVIENQIKHAKEVLRRYIDILNADVDNIMLGDAKNAEFVISKADDLSEAIKVAEQKAAKYKADVQLLEPWGNFDRGQIERLAHVGVTMHYHVAPSKGFDKIYPGYRDNIISQDSKQVYFVTFTQEGEDDVDALSVQLPEMSLSEAEQMSQEYSVEVDTLTAQQLCNAEHLGDILAYLKELENKAAFESAQCDTCDAAQGKVKVLEGWFPEDKQKDVEAFLEKADIYFETREPLPTDNVPVKFKNDGYSRMFERLTKMYGFPCYNEWDPTPIVAPFFTLFFAICMGDAGYGLLIALYGAMDMAGKTKKVPIVGEMLAGCGNMILALGVATTVIGFLLGTFFGINIVTAGWIPESTAIGGVLSWLQGNVPGTSYSIQMAAAISIGVFHICLAMIIKAALFTKKEGFASQISTWGWVLLLVGGVITGVLGLAGALSQDMMTIVLIAIGGIAALAIYILNNVGRLAKSPLKGILINPLAGLYDTYNMASGLMGDILSYIRLYALCLAGGMLGGAFNMIGDMVSDAAGWAIPFAVIIYIVGHIFNLLMSAISAFVHPLRLNFVEYFKNAGYEGKGVGYKPFEKK